MRFHEYHLIILLNTLFYYDFQVTFKHVKAHTGNDRGNDKADELAVQGCFKPMVNKTEATSNDNEMWKHFDNAYISSDE